MASDINDHLKNAFDFLNDNKIRRAKSAIMRAVSGVEVSWEGSTFNLYPADNYSDRVFWKTGIPDEEQSIRKLLSLVSDRVVTFWDIGANCGIFSVLVGNTCKKGSKIFSFEPNPEMFRRLNNNIRANKLSTRVTLKNIALSDEVGETSLHIYEGNLGRATLRSNDDKSKDREIRVAVEPLAAYLAQAVPNSLKVIKIDVEGFEDRVLMPWINQSEKLDEVDYLLIEDAHRTQWGTDVISELMNSGFEAVFSGEGNMLLQSPSMKSRLEAEADS